MLQLVLHAFLVGFATVQCSLAQDTPTLTKSVILGALEDPWDLAFLPSGDILFTEKCKGLSLLKADNTTVFLFGIDAPLDGEAADVFCEGQSGVLGVTVDPEFSSNRFIYTYVASMLGAPDDPDASSPATNHVVRLTLSTMDTVSERVDIVTEIPFKNQATPSGDSGAHSGGRIRFSPNDGFLYITTGDNHSPTIPQDTSSLGSCVLRVDRDGEAAPGNGMPAGADPRIYTYGHRNVQGIAFRPGASFNGQPFTAEHGPNHSDEVTPLLPGGNAGWDPKNRPSLDCPGDYCGYSGTPETMPMTDTNRFPDAMLPAWVWQGENRGMGPAEFLNGSQWGAWDGQLVVGLMADNSIYKLDLDVNGNATDAEKVPGLPDVRYRTLIQGPGGALYAVVDVPAELWKIEPSGVETGAPVAAPAPGVQPPPSPSGTVGAPAPDSEAESDSPADREVSEESGSSTLGFIVPIAVLVVSAYFGLLLVA